MFMTMDPTQLSINIYGRTVGEWIWAGEGSLYLCRGPSVIQHFLVEWDPLVNMNQKFNATNIPNIRVKYANEMIFHHTNTAREELRILKTFDPEDSQAPEVFPKGSKEGHHMFEKKLQCDGFSILQCK